MSGGMLARAVAVIVMVASVAASPVGASDLAGTGNVRAGRDLAVTHCSECHVVVPRRLTPRRVGGPPDFADIANARGTTRMALFVFLHAPHPTMPNLILSAHDSNDAIAYILSLRTQQRR